MAGEAIRAASGGHTRRTELEAVRQVSLVALIMLVVQYGLGIVVNLYTAVPAADAHAGLAQEIANGLEDQVVAVLATAGLTAIGGAFASGEIFVRNGQNGASLAMALLGSVAMLCHRRPDPTRSSPAMAAPGWTARTPAGSRATRR
jgi:hypothetical protein